MYFIYKFCNLGDNGIDSKATTENGESLTRIKIIDAMHRDDYVYMVMGNAVERNDANGDDQSRPDAISCKGTTLQEVGFHDWLTHQHHHLPGKPNEIYRCADFA